MAKTWGKRLKEIAGALWNKPEARYSKDVLAVAPNTFYTFLANNFRGPPRNIREEHLYEIWCVEGDRAAQRQEILPAFRRACQGSRYRVLLNVCKQAMRRRPAVPNHVLSFRFEAVVNAVVADFPVLDWERASLKSHFMVQIKWEVQYPDKLFPNSRYKPAETEYERRKKVKSGTDAAILESLPMPTYSNVFGGDNVPYKLAWPVYWLDALCQLTAGNLGKFFCWLADQIPDNDHRIGWVFPKIPKAVLKLIGGIFLAGSLATHTLATLTSIDGLAGTIKSIKKACTKKRVVLDLTSGREKPRREREVAVASPVVNDAAPAVPAARIGTLVAAAQEEDDDAPVVVIAADAPVIAPATARPSVSPSAATLPESSVASRPVTPVATSSSHGKLKRAFIKVKAIHAMNGQSLAIVAGARDDDNVVRVMTRVPQAGAAVDAEFPDADNSVALGTFAGGGGGAEVDDEFDPASRPTSASRNHASPRIPRRLGHFVPASPTTSPVSRPVTAVAQPPALSLVAAADDDPPISLRITISCA